MSFESDYQNRVDELEQAMTANDAHLQKVEAENEDLTRKIEGLSKRLDSSLIEANQLRELNAELLAVLKDALDALNDGECAIASTTIRVGIANAEKLK